MPRNRTREEYHEQMTTLAREAFANHQISERLSERHWLLQRPYTEGAPGWDWTYAAEIVVTRSGNILVTGDIGPMIFGHYSEPRKNPKGGVHWMGRQRGVDSYITEKASIGMGGGHPDSVYHWDTDIARADLNDYYRERVEELREEITDHVTAEAEYDEVAVDPAKIERRLNEAIKTDAYAQAYQECKNDLDMGPDIALQPLGECDDGWEIASGIGRVTDPTVYYAWAALERLSILFNEEEKDAEEKCQTNE